MWSGSARRRTGPTPGRPHLPRSVARWLVGALAVAPSVLACVVAPMAAAVVPPARYVVRAHAGRWTVTVELPHHGRSVVRRTSTSGRDDRRVVRDVVDAAVVDSGDTVIARRARGRIRFLRWSPGGRLADGVPGFPATVPASWARTDPLRIDYDAGQEAVTLLWAAGDDRIRLVGRGGPPEGADDTDPWPIARLPRDPARPCPASRVGIPGSWGLAGALGATVACDAATRTTTVVGAPRPAGTSTTTAFETPTGVLGAVGVVYVTDRQGSGALEVSTETRLVDLTRSRVVGRIPSPATPTIGPPPPLVVALGACGPAGRQLTVDGVGTPLAGPSSPSDRFPPTAAPSGPIYGAGWIAWTVAPFPDRPGSVWVLDAAGAHPVDAAGGPLDPTAARRVTATATALTIERRDGTVQRVVPAPAGPQSWPAAGACP